MAPSHRFAVLLTAACLAACGGGGDGGTSPPPPPDTTPASLTLAPSTPVTLVSGASTTITATVKNKSGGTVAATVTWSTGDASIAQVSNGLVSAIKVGTTTITATAGTVSAAVSVTVTPGAAAALGIRTQPGGAVIGSALSTQPVLEIRDAAGNVVTTSTASVTASIASGGGTLGGSSTVTAAAGVVAFSNLSIAGSAGDRTLGFASTGLASATSAPFTMTPPPTPTITLDQTAVTLAVGRGTNPAAVTVKVTNGGVAPLTNMSLDPVTFGAGEATGWLTASLSATTAPANITLTGATSSLADGTYHATVKLNAPGATNTPATITVTLTVTTSFNVGYGTATEKVRILDIGTAYTPTVTIADAAGNPVPGVTVTFTSRAATVATVDAAGRITARGVGDTWVAATTSQSSDSVFVSVPPSTTGPLLRSGVTTWSARRGDTLTFTVVLDTRGTTVGSALISFELNLTSGGLNNILPTAAAGPPVPVINQTSPGNNLPYVLRADVSAAAGMTGTVALVTVKVIGSTTTPATGMVIIRPLDVVGIDGTSLLPLMLNPTRVPIVFR